MADFHSYRPADGHRLPHYPLNAIVAPRRIGWISRLDEAGVANLAPYSFFNLINYRPPLIAFSSVGLKDSVANIRATGEFVWNLATRAQADAMNRTSAAVAPGVDEFVLAGVDSLPSDSVAPRRVAGSPAQFECKLTQLVRLQDKDGEPIDSWLVVGEAVTIHIDTAMLENGVYQTGRARPIMRGGGPADYFEVGEAQLFRMGRPV